MNWRLYPILPIFETDFFVGSLYLTFAAELIPLYDFTCTVHTLQRAGNGMSENFTFILLETHLLTLQHAGMN